MKAKGLKRKIFVIITWILFLVAVSFALFQIEKSICSNKTKTELMDQADIISRQFPRLIENDYYSKIIAQKILLSELKSISFALEKYDDIRQAEAFLNALRETAGIDIYIYGRNGDVLYGSNPDQELQWDNGLIGSILDSRSYEQLEDSFGYYDAYHQYRHITDYFPSEELRISWGVKDQWLLVLKDSFVKSQKETEAYFDWDNVLQSIRVGRTGSVLAVSKGSGNILSFRDEAHKGSPVTNLSIRIGREKETASLDRLLDEFQGPNTVSEIEVDGVRYYASRLNFDYDLLLAMIPVAESVEDAVGKINMLILFAAVISGIGAFYVFFHLGANPKEAEESSEKRRRGKALQGAVKLFSALAVILILSISLLLEALNVYAQTFRYTADKVTDVVRIMNSNQDAMEELQTWFDQEYLAKCNIARCILSFIDPKQLNDPFISDLADCLDVRYLSVFDEEGKILFTNAPSDRTTITKSSPFYALLEGKSYLIQEPEMDEIAGEDLQKVGVSLLNDRGRTNGCLIIAASTDEMSALADNLSFEDVLQQVCMTDGTFVLAVNNSDLTIENMMEVRGFSYKNGFNSSDYTGLPVSSLEINEKHISDDFNGSLSVLKKPYFASIKRTDNHYLMVMRPLIRISSGDILPVIFVTACILLFTLLLIFVISRAADRSGTDPSEADPSPHEDGSGNEDEDSQKNDDITVFWGNIINKNKPFFEERWPSDGKKWKDKSADEKSSSVTVLLIILTLVTIIVHALIAGENSVWYYCFNGQWERGINIYSITSCIIWICILCLSKMLIHKVLYLIARAVKSKGETICHLLNSFLGYALLISIVFVCLGTLGVNTTALSLTGGVAGVIFGIGCQNIVADILAGILMTFEGVARVGDFVSFNNKVGVILSIGVRTTRLKWFNEVTIVRNNEFKNYVNFPSVENDRIVTTLSIDLMESLEQVESIIENEIPHIHENLCEILGEKIEPPNYRGVQSIDQNGTTLSFSLFCKGMHYGLMTRMLNRELKLMCERNGIRIAMPQIVINTRDEARVKNS